MRACGTFAVRVGRFGPAATGQMRLAAAAFSRARTVGQRGLSWMKKARKVCRRSRGGALLLRSLRRNRTLSMHSLKLRSPGMVFIDQMMEAKPGRILIAVKT